MNRPGKLFEESYNQVDILSKSESQTILLVQHRKSQNYFICKHYNLTSLSQPEINSILNEIRILSSHQHPNIIRLVEHIKGDSEIALIEEYCEGRDLACLIRSQAKKGVPFKQQLVEQWILQILLALDYLHNNKIIHRNLKPSNIFLTLEGNVKVGSFALSKSLQKQKFTSTCVGSPCFMSPEIINSKPYDIRTDIWSFGCVAYELCMLKPPFDTPNLIELISKISKSEPECVPVSYSAFLSNIVKRCLRKNPEKRPSAFELIREPYFHSVMAKFVDNDGMILKRQVPVKKRKPKVGLPETAQKGHKNTSVSSKEIRHQAKEQFLSQKVTRKGVDTKKVLVKLPPVQTRERREQHKSIQKPSSKSRQVQKPKEQVNKSRQKSARRKDQQEKTKTPTQEQKLEPNVQPKPSNAVLKPSIPISPCRKPDPKHVAKKQSSKAKTEENSDQIKIDAESYVQQQEVDFNLTKTGKFEGKFDFLKKPPVLAGSPSGSGCEEGRDSDTSFDQSWGLTLTMHQIPRLVQTIRSKMEEVSRQISQKYQPNMQVIQERTFQFGSDEFVKEPGNFEFK